MVSPFSGSRALALGFLVLAILATWPASAQARSPGVFLVPLSDQRPAMTVGPLGEVGGVVKQFLDAVAQGAGLKFRYEGVPRARALREFKNGTAALLYAAQTQERDAEGLFLPAIQAPVDIIGLRSALGKDPAAAVEARTGLRMAVVRGFDYGPAYRTLVEGYRRAGALDEVRDPETVFRMIQAHRAHFTLAPGSIAASPIEDLGLLDQITAVVYDKVPPTRAGFYLSKALGAEDRQRLEAALRRELQNGLFWRLSQEALAPWAMVGVRPLPD